MHNNPSKEKKAKSKEAGPVWTKDGVVGWLRWMPGVKFLHRPGKATATSSLRWIAQDGWKWNHSFKNGESLTHMDHSVWLSSIQFPTCSTDDGWWDAGKDAQRQSNLAGCGGFRSRDGLTTEWLGKLDLRKAVSSHPRRSRTKKAAWCERSSLQGGSPSFYLERTTVCDGLDPSMDSILDPCWRHRRGPTKGENGQSYMKRSLLPRRRFLRLEREGNFVEATCFGSQSALHRRGRRTVVTHHSEGNYFGIQREHSLSVTTTAALSGFATE